MLLLLVLAPLMAWMPAPARAAPRPAPRCTHATDQALLDAVRVRYRGKSLRATFSQTYTDAVMGARPAERGQLAIDRTGRMRFAYQAPEQKIFVYDGHTASFEESAAKQVTVLDHFEHSQAALALRLLTGGASQSEAFVRTSNTTQAAAHTGLLSFVPAAGQQGFARAELVIDRASCEIAEVRVIDGIGNSSAYVLHDRQLGVVLPAATFERRVPTGFDVLHVDVSTPPGTPAAT